MSDGLAEPHALAIINNHVSLSMLLADLDMRGIRSTNTKVICLRKVRLPRNEFADVLQYPDAQSGVASRWQSMRFYRSAARTLRSWMSDTRLRHAYIVNGNNLLTNHLLQMAASSQFDVSVVAEGLLNFADVEVEQHGAWRGSVRSVAAPMMRLRYASPAGHHSGAYEPAVTRVVSFASAGLRAPPDRVVVRRWPNCESDPAQVRPSSALIVHTGLHRLMKPPDYRVFAEGFAEWIRRQEFAELFAKRHPRSSDPMLEALLPEHEVIGDGQALEELASQLTTGVVIGPGTTPLVTLKMMRPELRCVDFGADYYVPRLYGGSDSLHELLKATGVERVPFDRDAWE